MDSKKKTEAIRKEVLNWIWWEEDHDDSEPLLWAVAEKIVDLTAERDEWRKVAESLHANLSTYVCRCNLSKCKCGYDYAMEEYEELKAGENNG